MGGHDHPDTPLMSLCIKFLVGVEGVCGVCAVDGWFTASPGLSQTDWTLAGWGCTPVVHESNHGTQDKPAITTHTGGGAKTMAVCTISSVNTTSLNLYINTLNNIYPCPVSEGPKESHLGGMWSGKNPATVGIIYFCLIFYIRYYSFISVISCTTRPQKSRGQPALGTLFRGSGKFPPHQTEEV